MKGKRLTVVGIAASVLAPLVFFVVAGVLMWTPPPHEVHTPGATAITNLHFAQTNSLTMNDPDSIVRVGYSRSLRPSLSLADMRCQAWQSIPSNASRPCPDATTLEGKFWSAETQGPNTLYLWLPPLSCLGYGGGKFNLEYLKSNQALVIHCYSSAPRLEIPSMHLAGVRALITGALLVVATDQIGPGDLTVVEDDRVERLAVFGDVSSQVELGSVTIS